MRWSGCSGGLVAGAGSGASRSGVFRMGVVASGGRDVMTVSGLGDITSWAHVTRPSSLNHRG